jgi:hypothetical protein
MLQSYGAAGDVVYQRLYPGLDIRPSQEFYGDIQYCVEDWHVVALLWEDPEYTVLPDGPVRTRDDVVDFLGGLKAEFELDGQSVATTRTPFKPYRDPFLVDYWEQYLAEQYGDSVTLGNLWAVQWGRALAPDDLSVGLHTLSVMVTDPEPNILFDQQVTFWVYPSDSEACTGA